MYDLRSLWLWAAKRRGVAAISLQNYPRGNNNLAAMSYLLLALRRAYVRPSLILLFVLCACPMDLLAQSRGAEFKAREMAAKKFCNVGEYQKGIDLLGDLYVETNIPTYVFNQGRCYQQNDRYEKAISHFREYLRKSPGLSEEEKSLVNGHIEECAAQLTKQNPPPAPVQTPPPSSAESKPLLTMDQPPSESLQSTVDNPGHGLRIAGVITGFMGIAALGTGAGLLWYHNKEVNRYKALPERPTDADENLRQYKTLSLVGFGVGGAALVTGILLYYFGSQSGTVETTSPKVTVALGPHGTFLTWTGAFH